LLMTALGSRRKKFSDCKTFTVPLSETKLKPGELMPSKSVDWQSIRETFEKTELSVSAIARTRGISHTAINKRAEKERWAINAERIELKAKASGLTIARPEPALKPVDWGTIRRLYEGTKTSLAKIALYGAHEGEILLRAENEKWLRFGASRSSLSGSSEYRDGAMRDTATPPSKPAPPLPPAPRIDLRRVRSPRRDVITQDTPLDLPKVRKVAPSQLADVARDGLLNYLINLRDLTANRHIVRDMIEEWNEDNPDKESVYEKLKLLPNIKELGLMWKNAGAAYRAFTDGGEEKRKDGAADAIGDRSSFCQPDTTAEACGCQRKAGWLT